MKRICCICSEEFTPLAEDLLTLVRKYTKINIIMLSASDSVEEFEVVVFVLSKDVLSNAIACKQLKEASDFNKIFIPVILGGNWFKSWLLKRSYKGPDLRTSFLELRKDLHMFEFLQQLANYGGSKIRGDIYGSEAEFNVDLDCKVLRNNELIAETGNSHNIKITLYKGQHKLVFQSIKYPELIEEVSVKVKSLTSEIRMDVKIAKHRHVNKRSFAGGYYEGSLYLDDRDGEGTFYFPNGDVYSGFWKNDIISGKGLMKYSSGETYDGDWLDGKRHGYGKLTYYNNNYYEGEFVNDKVCGKGKRYYSDGSYYDGSWSNGDYHGKGTKRFADGSKYVGDWVKGFQHGHGIEYDANGEKVFEGEWKNGQKQTIINRIKNWWNSL